MRRAGDRRPKSRLRWLTLAWRLAGQTADSFDVAEAWDVAHELVWSGRVVDQHGRLVSSGRLRPYADWAGGDELAEAMAAAEAERARAQAEGMF